MAASVAGSRSRIGQQLVEAGVVSIGQLQEALRLQPVQRGKGDLIGSILVELGYLGQADLLQFLFQQFRKERLAYQVVQAKEGIIEFRGIEKILDGRRVLDGIDLVIPRGKITAVIGVSGGGKSVTLKHMVGLMKPTRGSVLVGGRDLATLSTKELSQVRRRFSMLFQGGALFDSLSVFDNVAFPLRETTGLSEEVIRHRVERALKEVNLAGMGGKFPDDLSGGMSKRVALARALVTEPEILLLDEPTAGLDPIIENAIHYLICDTFMRTRLTMVLISHAVPDIFNWCHHVVALHQGKVLESAPSWAIAQSENPVIRQFIRGDLEGPIQVI
ncbi:MAG: ATP-binding cassette domain-containing protein [Magnetococcales bacterium]|nr:ATP-binding cassette domain-containing protein [Magnetococcales bacterium]